MMKRLLEKQGIGKPELKTREIDGANGVVNWDKILY